MNGYHVPSKGYGQNPAYRPSDTINFIRAVWPQRYFHRPDRAMQNRIQNEY